MTKLLPKQKASKPTVREFIDAERAKTVRNQDAFLGASADDARFVLVALHCVASGRLTVEQAHEAVQHKLTLDQIRDGSAVVTALLRVFFGSSSTPTLTSLALAARGFSENDEAWSSLDCCVRLLRGLTDPAPYIIDAVLEGNPKAAGASSNDVAKILRDKKIPDSKVAGKIAALAGHKVGPNAIGTAIARAKRKRAVTT